MLPRIIIHHKSKIACLSAIPLQKHRMHFKITLFLKRYFLRARFYRQIVPPHITIIGNSNPDFPASFQKKFFCFSSAVEAGIKVNLGKSVILVWDGRCRSCASPVWLNLRRGWRECPLKIRLPGTALLFQDKRCRNLQKNAKSAGFRGFFRATKIRFQKGFLPLQPSIRTKRWPKKKA